MVDRSRNENLVLLWKDANGFDSVVLRSYFSGWNVEYNYNLRADAILHGERA